MPESDYNDKVLLPGRLLILMYSKVKGYIYVCLEDISGQYLSDRLGLEQTQMAVFFRQSFPQFMDV